jgi:hypothetical protein
MWNSRRTPGRCQQRARAHATRAGARKVAGLARGTFSEIDFDSTDRADLAQGFSMSNAEMMFARTPTVESRGHRPPFGPVQRRPCAQLLVVRSAPPPPAIDAVAIGKARRAARVISLARPSQTSEVCARRPDLGSRTIRAVIVRAGRLRLSVMARFPPTAG